ncbi:MAG: helix-turn-helix transcriptional regulator [Natronohydrobacter sp.]|nr:helix-turn-helix transcriptional regulator [Natronohydrobacter sp.]
MSIPLVVCHGPFGRVCLYRVDRGTASHAHREGHLIFHVDGPAGAFDIDGKIVPVSAGQGVAVSPWQTHMYLPVVADAPMLQLVLYISPAWFLETARQVTSSLNFGRPAIEITDHLAALISSTARAMMEPELDDPLMEERLHTLTHAAFDQSWQWTEHGSRFFPHVQTGRDFRIRKALRLLEDKVGEISDLDEIAREVGLSRAHFFKLFREQVGLTPKLYLNALLMENAIGRLTQSAQAVADIGFDLGFSSQASFSRFFIANGVVAPSAYRRSVHMAVPN